MKYLVYQKFAGQECQVALLTRFEHERVVVLIVYHHV